jgi:chemotaxis protein methyltransferase CheR
MTSESVGTPRDDFDLELDLLLEAVVRRYGYDFRDYARASLRRRIRGAMQVMGAASISMLQHEILRDPTRFTLLLTRLTVPVSDLFRDPAYFQAVRRDVIPLLETYPSVKIWVAGCSTGEEVYSLAVLLDEVGLLSRTHIYATDINPEALRTAVEGVYPVSRVAQFTENYQRAGGSGSLADHYTAAYGHAVFHARLRARVTFSDHSLATDQVFAEVQFVSCRNVLIYFNARLQTRAIGLFRDSLVVHGFLGLGSHERLAPGEREAGFREVSRAERIYQRLAHAR